ncbi:MAG: glycoside hydrolase N-terminal domain-containing protein, partial [Victivallales bacterium]
DSDWEGGGRLLLEKLQPSGTHATAMSEYQPACDLLFEMSTTAPACDYERTLDLSQGVATVNFSAGLARYGREYFVSAVDGFLGMRITCDKPNSISGTLWLERDTSADCVSNIHAEGNILRYRGVISNSVLFEAAVQILTRDGRTAVSADRQRFTVVNVSELVVFVSIEVAETSAALGAVPTRTFPTDWSASLAAHVAEHEAIHGRVSLSLGDRTEAIEKTTDRLVHKAFVKEPDVRLFELMFQMGRYLTMAASRPGSMAMTLQGIWNHKLHPPWQSDWHLDMNVQMCYWLAEAANINECVEPLFDLAESLIPDGEENARNLFGCRGVVFPIACAGGGKPLPGPWVAWTGAAGWLAQHFWQHYEYTLDLEFLRGRAYPFMRKVAEFYEDYLIKDNHGLYMVVPSLSPENVPAERGAWAPHKIITGTTTMDVAIISELLGNLLEAVEVLGLTEEKVPVWQEIVDHLPSWPVDGNGMLREWCAEEHCDNSAHRHFSHLYPLFPGSLFTREKNPHLVEAAAKALQARKACGYAENAGWSYPYLALLHARLGEGDAALECLSLLARCAMMGNLLTIHNDWRFQGLTLYWPMGDRAFMIEALLGAAAAIAEMLLQSQGNLIRILPALPKAWSQGEVRGMRARGAFEIDIAWTNGCADTVGIKSLAGRNCRLVGMPTVKPLCITCQGKVVPVQANPQGILEFPTKSGALYLVCAQQD